MIDYLDLEDLLALAEDLQVGPVHDHGLLESAVARPRTTVFGEDAYPRLVDKAAALLHSICKNHPLTDGNERLAWLATDVFLRINDLVVTMADDDAFELVMGVADGTLGLPDIAEALERATRPE